MKFLTLCISIFFGFTLIQTNVHADKKHTLVACAESWPPYDFILKGKVTGTDVQLNKEIFNELNLKIRIVIIPWQQCWNFIKSGKMDIAFMVSKKEFRKPYVFYPDISINNLKFAWITNENNRIRSVKICPNLKNLNMKVGIVKDNSYSNELLTCFNKKENIPYVIKYNTLNASIKMLLLNKVQLLPAIPEIAKYLSNKINRGQIYTYPTTILNKNYYTIFSKKSKFHNDKYYNIQQIKDAFNTALMHYQIKNNTVSKSS